MYIIIIFVFNNFLYFYDFRIKLLNSAIDEYASDKKNLSSNDYLTIGSPCLAKINDTYSRAKIKSFSSDENGSRATVFFVDFGQTEDVPINDIISISYELIEMLPYQVNFSFLWV